MQQIELFDDRLVNARSATPTDEGSSAVISACRQYRYELRRGRAPYRLYVMLNPSTADALTDDPTIRRCLSFAARDELTGIIVVNLFAWRATQPADLFDAQRRGFDIVGPDNDRTIKAVATTAQDVVVAWGAGSSWAERRSIVEERARQVLGILRKAGAVPRCLALTSGGQPWHPLYLPKDAHLIPFEERNG